jgi:hypothetical protein
MVEDVGLYKEWAISGFETLHVEFNRRALPLLRQRNSPEDADALAELVDKATDHLIRTGKGYYRVRREREDSPEDTKKSVFAGLFASKERDQDPCQALVTAYNTVLKRQLRQAKSGSRITVTDIFPSPDDQHYVTNNILGRSDWMLRAEQEARLTAEEKEIVREAIDKAYRLSPNSAIKAFMVDYYLTEHSSTPHEGRRKKVEYDYIYRGTKAVREIVAADHSELYTNGLGDKLTWLEYLKKPGGPRQGRKSVSDVNGRDDNGNSGNAR